MSEMRDPKTVWNPWLYNPFAEFVKAGYSATPQKLNQPILPGWTFGNIISVSERNSSSPDTERRIVDQHSYGRQLGHLMDAMCDLSIYQFRSTPQSCGSGRPDCINLTMRRSPRVNQEVLLRATFLG